MGIKRVDNPPNPYESTHHEWLEEAPEISLEVYEEPAGQVLSCNESPDVGFRWSVNPYRGCQHGCAYCYARPSHEYLGFGAGTDFETKIVVKPNAPERLEKAFRHRTWAGELVAFSGVTDCYQPLEAIYQLTRRCLEVCLRFRNPVAVVTKSYLVVRDADLLADLAVHASARVMISVPFADPAVSRLIEPHAPSPDRRFQAMGTLCDAGVPVGILTSPIIPGLNDADIPMLLKRAADNGATAAGYVALRLSGSVRPVFLGRLRQVMPSRYEKIISRIRQVRNGRLSDSRFGHRMRGQGAYWDSIRDLFEMTARRLNLVRRFTDDVQEAESPDPPDKPGSTTFCRSGAPAPGSCHQQLSLPFA